jgi:Fur family transcriptional regulator, ferric uptake regulator
VTATIGPMAAADTHAWVEHALDAMARAGYRRGGARRAVLDVLARQRCAATAREIDDRVRRAGRPIGLASVYRVLEELADLRLVQRVEVGQGAARYEPLRPDGDHHHHLVCDRCGEVTPFQDARLEHAIAQLASAVEFAVDDHEVVLHGSCPTCAR